MNRQTINKILVIARHEFITAVSRPAFLVVTLGMPVVILGVIWLEMLLFAHTLQKELANTAAVVDRSGLVNLDFRKQFLNGGPRTMQDLEKLADRIVELQRYDDLDRALEDLAQRRLFACYVIEGDYLKTGKIMVYTRESRIGVAKSYLGERDLVMAIRASLLEGRVADDIRERALNPANFERMEVSTQGQINPETSRIEKFYSFFAPALLCMLLGSSIFMSAGYLISSLILENQNRVMEVLLSSVRPVELLLGKVLGLGAVGLIPATIYGTIPTLALAPYFAMQGWRLPVLAVIYVGLGYLLFSVLMTATGVIVNGMQESTQLSGIWSMISGLPVIAFILSSDLNSWLARAMSWFPLTAPTSMLIRLCFVKVAAWDILLSIFFLMAGIFTALWFTVKIFRASSLMYGKRPRLSELRRWLREA
ncbi:MAG: ABC transporter permease [Blastocatellia bacterium]